MKEMIVGVLLLFLATSSGQTNFSISAPVPSSSASFTPCNTATTAPPPQSAPSPASSTGMVNCHEITSGAGLNVNTDEQYLISSPVEQSMDHPISRYGTDGGLMREVGNSTSPPPAGDFGFTISAAPLSTSRDQSTNNSTAMPTPQLQHFGTPTISH